MQITSETQREQVLTLRQSISSYQQNADLLAIGAYQPGANPEVDAAIALWPDVQAFLRQRPDEQVTRAESLDGLAVLAGRGAADNAAPTGAAG